MLVLATTKLIYGLTSLPCGWLLRDFCELDQLFLDIFNKLFLSTCTESYSYCQVHLSSVFKEEVNEITGYPPTGVDNKQPLLLLEYQSTIVLLVVECSKCLKIPYEYSPLSSRVMNSLTGSILVTTQFKKLLLFLKKKDLNDIKNIVTT